MCRIGIHPAAWILVVCTLVSAASTLVAEDRPYSLTQALNDTLVCDPSIAAAAANAQAAKHLATAAASVYWPRISQSASVGLRSLRGIGEAGEFRTFENAMSLRWELVNAQRWAERAAALTSASAADRRASETRRQVLYSTVSAYLAVIRARGQLDAAEQSVQVAEQEVVDIRARIAAGVDAETALPRAELSLAQARQRISEARETVAVAEITLASAIGHLVPDALAPIAEPPLPTADPAQWSQLVANRQDVLAAHDDLRSEAAALTGQQRWWWPTIAAEGGTTTVRRYGDYGASYLAGRDESWNVGLSAELLMFDGFRRREEIAAQQQVVLRTQEDLRTRQRDAETKLATAQARLVARRDSVAQAEATLKQAQSNAASVASRRAAGLATTLDSADAIASLYQARIDRIDADLLLRLAQFSLREAVGWWPLSEIATTRPASSGER